MTFLAQLVSPGSTRYAVPIAAAVIAVLILVLSIGDVSRFRFARVRAIAGVCFTEAIRRRVLWITPLAILGVIAVTQLTRPLDAQDAIRQTTKYCIFASGLIVVLTAILLAAANLPKEMESRVIFTIVTKPTTRLEIVLGKVLGFAMVSGMILLIMGLFTFAYLEVRAWSMEKQIRSALEAGQYQGSEKVRLQRYADQGLLGTKSVVWPNDVQIYGKEPSPDGTRWAAGSSQTFMIVPFNLTQEQKESVVQAVNAGGSPLIVVTLKIDRHQKINREEQELLDSGDYPMGESETFGPAIPTTQPQLPVPQIAVAARTQKDGSPVAESVFSGGQSFSAERNRQWQPGGERQFVIPFTANDPLEELLSVGSFNLEITGVTPTLEYGAGRTPAELIVMPPKGSAAPPLRIPSSVTETIRPQVSAGGVDVEAEPPGTRFYSRYGRAGMQLAGRPFEEGNGPVAIYEFQDVTGIEPTDGKVVLQTKISVDRIGDLDADRYRSSVAAVTVRNTKTGVVSDPVMIEPDTNRVIDVQVPAAAVEGGSFQVLVRGRTPGQYLGVHGLTATIPSIALVQAEQAFGFNLFKGLLVLWMLATLVVTISVFCSTFLSWPIAVILTVVLLMGRWGVNQLGDALNPGQSRGVVQDLFKPRDPSKTQAVTDSLEALSYTLRTVAPVLPDVNRFPVMEDIDRGVSIPLAKLLRALLELLVYGVPLVLLTYVILRNKEVAP